MISSIEGQLVDVREGRAEIRCGPITYALFVPAADQQRLLTRLGDTITFYTLHYFEGQGQGSSLLPRLIGFGREEDRTFFELFTTVKGMGNRKALRALALPFEMVAEAIAARDFDVLKSLPEIGKRTAETIVAELHGKVDRFVELKPVEDAAQGDCRGEKWALVRDVVAMLTQLGEPRLQAQQLVDRVLRTDPTIDSPDALLAAAYRLKETPVTNSRYAMIMAGGVGTRLWPMSRRDRPKQLLPLIGGRSLLELAAHRLEGLVPPERRYVCTGEGYRTAVRAALPEVADDHILGEPAGRNTVNAVGFTAALLAKHDPDAIFAVLTADHVIEPSDEFRRRLDVGFALVEADASRFVTFSIRPTFAATGYGYVERGAPIDGFDNAFVAERFVEKPDAPTAQRYLETDTFGWNSGMFVYQAAAYMAALERFLPASFAGIQEIAAAWGTGHQASTLERVYPDLPSISVDYAVMEPAVDDDAIRVCTVPMGVTWMDVGSWPSYGETLPPDPDACRTNARTLHLDSTNVLAVSDDPSHTIATVDCHDIVIVHTTDVTMVCPASKAQRVRDLADAAGDERQ